MKAILDIILSLTANFFIITSVLILIKRFNPRALKVSRGVENFILIVGSILILIFIIVTTLVLFAGIPN